MKWRTWYLLIISAVALLTAVAAAQFFLANGG